MNDERTNERDNDDRRTNERTANDFRVQSATLDNEQRASAGLNERTTDNDGSPAADWLTRKKRSQKRLTRPRGSCDISRRWANAANLSTTLFTLDAFYGPCDYNQSKPFRRHPRRRTVQAEAKLMDEASNNYLFLR